MKLYVNEENEVILDYRDVDFEAGRKSFTDKDFNRDCYEQCREYYNFVRESPCSWISTLRPKEKRMHFGDNDWDTKYMQSYRLLKSLDRIYNIARNSSYIEICAGLKEYIEEIRQRTEKLYQIERTKEMTQERRREWNRVCRNGCGSCPNKCKQNDDYVCRASGDLLPERNSPGYAGGVYQLFNFIPYPTDNCPLNIEKQGA